MTGGPRPGALLPVLARLLVALLVLASASPALAQAPDEDEFSVLVEWGYSGVLVAERWMPIRLEVSSGDRAVSGVFEISYRQDAAQNARITLPFATTPGRAVPVEAVVCVPPGCEEMTIRAIDERGRRLASMRIEATPDDPLRQMPLVITAEGATFLCVGDDSLLRALDDLRKTGDPPDDDDRAAAQVDVDPWAQLIAWPGFVSAAPSSWMAYDAATAVVLPAGQLTALRPEALSALRQWLESGGTIVLLADAPDADAWRMLMAPGVADSIARLGAPTTVPTPAALADAVGDAAPEVAARPITLTDRARSMGWTTRWAAGEHALLAEGPVGFGWVTLLGVHPRRVGAIVSDQNTADVWHDALKPLVEEWTDAAPERNWYPTWNASGALPRHKSAISTILDHTLRVETPGMGVLIVLVSFVVLLAVLVGPVDAIVLRKLRKRRLSWATALAYTAVATLLAASVPAAMRSGRTVYTRASAVDVLAPGLGGGAHQTSLSSIFAAGSERLSIDDPPPSSWWRPVSALSSWSEVLGGPTFNTAQSSRATSEGLVRGNVPRPSSLRLWTLRTTIDQGPATPPLVTAQLDGASCVVRVPGLGGIDRIETAHARLPGADGAATWVGAEWATDSDGALVLRLPASPGGVASPMPEAWSPVRPEDESRYTPWSYTGYLGYQPSRFFDLPGAWRRSRAIDAYINAGSIAMIVLEVWRDEPSVAITSSADTAALEVYRILVPLPPAADSPEEPTP